MISHYNLFRSAEIDGSAAPGFSSGQAIGCHGGAEQEGPAARLQLSSGRACRSKNCSSGSTTLILFGLGTLVVYLTLSAQYESFVLPFIVLLAVPMALLGALAAQSLRGLENDVYCQIGLVMLVGLSSKNAILIVEFAEQLRHRRHAAAGSRGRSGKNPAASHPDDFAGFHSGRRAAGGRVRRWRARRHSVGTTVFGGMIVSTVLNLFFIPVLI